MWIATISSPTGAEDGAAYPRRPRSIAADLQVPSTGQRQGTTTENLVLSA